jgi:hypothetical protein
MTTLELRPEFRGRHMQDTAIELSNHQNTGWTQRSDPNELLDISYPTFDVQRAILAVSKSNSGKPIVLLGQRGSGKSHIMALLHYAFSEPEAVEKWANGWSSEAGREKLAGLQLNRGFTPISDTLSDQENPRLWDIIFDGHPKGGYYRGKFEASQTMVPAKSLFIDMFKEQRTALIFDEMQTWFDGLYDEAGDNGLKFRAWAFNCIQTLSEIANERPDLLCLIVSCRDSSTEAFRQIHRNGPVVVDFKGESARQDRKRLVRHRLFKNRQLVSDSEIEPIVNAYSEERIRLLFSEKNPSEQVKLKKEVVTEWPFSPELLNLLEDHILMSSAAQGSRDMIRMLAEVYKSRGHLVPLLTPADFTIDDDECGIMPLLEAFTTSDQEKLRDKAIRNLTEIHNAGVTAPHAREVISSLWMRSLSAGNEAGGTKSEVQLDLTRNTKLDPNHFLSELSTIERHSFNIHPVGTIQERLCFKLEENKETQLRVHALNAKHYQSDVTSVPGLLPVDRDQEYIRGFINHMLKSPDSVSELPSMPIVLDPNWQQAPWANVKDSERPASWTDRPVLIVIPESPKELSKVLGPWLVNHVTINRNMVRFLIPKSEEKNIYDDSDLRILARCALSANEWGEADPQFKKLATSYKSKLTEELKTRFDRYALLDVWDFQTPANCTFRGDKHGGVGAKIPKAIEDHIRTNFFADDDFAKVVIGAAKRDETLAQLLALLQAEPLPGKQAIVYLGETQIYESVLNVVASDDVLPADAVAINVNSTWYKREPSESSSECLTRLRQKAWRTGAELRKIALRERDNVGSGGISVTPPTVNEPSPNSNFPPVVGPSTTPTIGGFSTAGGTTTPTISGTTNLPPISPGISGGVAPALPVIRRSMGAKTGMNLLGDIEQWGYGDKQTVTQATLTISGVSVKELRDFVTRMPPKLQGELQITLPPENEGGGK